MRFMMLMIPNVRDEAGTAPRARSCLWLGAGAPEGRV